MSMKQSIIIPFYKNKKELYFTLDLIKKYTPPDVEIVVVANNYDAKEIDVNYQNCNILKYNKSLLYARAANIGVNEASGEIITLVDQDIFVTAGWYEALIKKLISDKKIACVSSKMLNPSTGRIIEFGIEYTKYNSAHIGKNLLANSPLTVSDICVSSICGGVLMTYKDLYQELGGMDEDMPYICCDCDFSLKLLSNKREIWVVSQSIVYHKSTSSLSGGKYSDFSVLEHDSRWKFYQKNSERMRYELYKWTSRSYKSFLKRTQIILTRQYVFINLSSYQNTDWYIEQITKELNISILDQYDFIVPIRNMDKVQIYDYVPYDFMSLHTPIIYFVDSFLSLKENELWYSMRPIKHDIIADINGSICLVQELLDEYY